MNHLNDRLLRIMIKSREITPEKMQSFFQVNKEEMIELLIQFLEHDIQIFDTKAPEKNKYLFYTLDIIQEFYDMFDRSDCRLPFRYRFNMLQQDLFDLNHISKRKISQIYSLSIEEQIYLEIYYYKDIEKIKKFLSEDVIGKINEPLLIEEIITSYLESLKTDEYLYYKQILECLIQNGKDNHNLLFHISHCIGKHLQLIIPDFPKHYINRLRHTEQLLSDIHSKLVPFHREFQVSNKKKTSIDRPFIFTIDALKKYVKEDAISVVKQGDDLYVTFYIIDPCDKVFKNQELWDIAVYNWFYCDNNHLFGTKYAREYFSLEQGKSRKVIAFEYCFDKNKKVKELKIFEDKIRVDHNYTYDEITELLNTERKPKETIPYIKELYEVIQVLYDNNLHKKKYHLIKQLHYYLNNDERYRLDENRNSCMIVNELKILTNYSIARLCERSKIPCVYRNNQFVASDEEVTNLEQGCNEEDDVERLYQDIQKLNIESWYSDENKGHYGLNLDCYVHATTPVRNFFSLLNLKILKDVVIHKKLNQITQYEQLLEEFMLKQKVKVNRRKNGNQKVIKQQKEMKN